MNDEIPVGAVLVKDSVVIGEGWNQPIYANDPGAHAEMIALKQGGAKLGNYRLPGTTLYVTLEPCAMCAGAMVHARIDRLVFGAFDPKSGAAGSVFNIVAADKLNHRIAYQGGVLESECAELLQKFFAARR